jgi:hypothetical protein
LTIYLRVSADAEDVGTLPYVGNSSNVGSILHERQRKKKVQATTGNAHVNSAKLSRDLLDHFLDLGLVRDVNDIRNRNKLLVNRDLGKLAGDSFCSLIFLPTLVSFSFVASTQCSTRTSLLMSATTTARAPAAAKALTVAYTTEFL